MALSASSLKWYLSGGAGSAHNNSNAEPRNSLGGGISTVEIPSGALFRDVRDGEVGGSTYVYRGIYLKNTATGTVADDTAYNIRIWTSGVPANCFILMAASDSSPFQIPSGGTMASIATETTFPPQVGSGGVRNFEAYSTYADGWMGQWFHSTSGHLLPGYAFGFWIRRYTGSGYVANPGTFTLNARFSSRAL